MAEHYTYALGRRKSATAKARITNGKGKITINGKPAEEYLANAGMLLHELEKPFKTIEDNKYDVSIVVDGGGHVGQVGAIKLAISKALVEKNEALKGTLKKAGMLSRDSRVKERKKFGLKGARKQRQFTKR
jgi:small subunit ribosomal protein S9